MKRILVITFVIIITTNISSQVIKNIGVESGLVWATQRISGYEMANEAYTWDFDYKRGMNFMVSMEAFSKKPFSFIMALGITEKGMVANNEYYVDEDYQVFDSIQSYTNQLLYLSYNPGFRIWEQIGHFIPSLTAAIRVDYEVNADYEFLKPAENIKVLAGINLGMSAEYKWDDMGISLSGYYQHDFTPQHHARYRAFAYNSMFLYNKAFLLNLCFKYYFKKNQKK